MLGIGRRQFITLLGGAAARRPRGRWRRGRSRPSERGGSPCSRRLRRTIWPSRGISWHSHSLAQSGWIEGQNLRINIRWGGGAPDRIRREAAELIAAAPDVILTVSSATTAPLLEATRAVPVVFVQVAEPVGAGFVETLARPGGNATGLMLYEYGIGAEWLELLKEIAPGVKRAAFLQPLAVRAATGQFGATGLGSIARGGSAPH